VHRGDQLRHLGHLHAVGDIPADDAAGRDQDDATAASWPEPGPISVAKTASAMPAMPYQTARLALSWPDRPPRKG
jgi:hypothetical protein